MYVTLLVLIGLLVIAYSIVAGVKRGGGKEQADVVQAMEMFVRQMEAENDRVIELIASLRQKFDSQQLISERTLQSASKGMLELADRLTRLEAAAAPPAVRGSGSGRRPGTRSPEFLTGKYREAAVRLQDGQESAQIMRELDIGQGEIDLVTRILENGSAHS
ncbi:MAG: hypothetical protein ACYCYO_11485 [Bacilli bacterium]